MMKDDIVHPAASVAGPADVFVPEGEAVGLLLVDTARLPGTKEILHEAPHVIESAGVGDHDAASSFAGAIGDTLRLSQRQGQGNLDEHVFAGVEAGQRLVVVDLTRRGDDHGVQSVVVEGFVEVGCAALETVAFGKLSSRLGASTHDSARVYAVDLRASLGMELGDAAVTDKTVVQGVHLASRNVVGNSTWGQPW